jgi:hypothetical protein
MEPDCLSGHRMPRNLQSHVMAGVATLLMQINSLGPASCQSPFVKIL